MKNRFLKIILFLALFCLPLASAQAEGKELKKLVHILPDEIVSSTLYTAAEEIIVDGTINGDLIAISKKIVVNGQIDGDLIALAQNIEVNGQIGGNIRIISGNFTLNGLVNKNLNALAETIYLSDTSRVAWDSSLAGSKIEVDGKIDGYLQVLGREIIIRAEIGNDANLKTTISRKRQDLPITLYGALIKKDLYYTSPQEIAIDEASLITGNIEAKIGTTPKQGFLDQINWWQTLYRMLRALIFGLIIIHFTRQYLPDLLSKALAKPKKIIVPGLILLFVTPLAGALLILSIIGALPGALLLVSWFFAQYIAKLLLALLLGKLCLEFIFKDKPLSLNWALVTGIIIIYFLFALPWVGWLFSLIASLAGLGIFYLYVKDKLRNL